MTASVDLAIWHWFYVFCRMGAAVFVLPVFGENVVPVRVRFAAAAALTTLLAPLVPLVGKEGGVSLLLVEAAAGLVFGLLLRSYVWALQIGGAIAAQSVGASQILGAGVVVDPSPALVQVMVLGAMAVLCALDWPVYVLGYFLNSYTLWPTGQWPSPEQGLAEITAAIGRAFAFGLQLSAPYYIAGILYNAALGVISRAMPQLMVALIGAPVLTGIGLALSFASLPIIFAIWAQEVLSG